MVPGQCFDAGHTFLLGFVRQHWAGNNVADGINSRSARREVFADRYLPFCGQLDPDFFEAEILGVWLASDGHEHAVAFDWCAAFPLDNTPALFDAGRGNFGLQMEFEPLLL